MTDNELFELARNQLAKSGISEEQAMYAGIEPLHSAESAQLGFPAAPALRIPYMDTTGAPVQCTQNGTLIPFTRVRFLVDSVAKGFVAQSLPKYMQPSGTGVNAYFPRVTNIQWHDVTDDKSIRLFVTEGEKKALKACLEGFHTVGLGGVWNFRNEKDLLPEIAALNLDGRSVYIVFDSDAATNNHIKSAERALANLLIKHGAHVHVLRLPSTLESEKVGLDDFLVDQGGDAFRLLVEAATKLDASLNTITSGSEVELADALSIRLTERAGSEIIYDVGSFYSFNGTDWQAVPDIEVRKTIYEFDGTRIGTNSKLKLSKAKTEGTLAIFKDKAHQEGFFSSEKIGINCQNGFVTFDDRGNAAICAHTPDQRQRHTIRGNWNRDSSCHGELLSKLLEGCFQEDDEKKRFLQECLGMAALGIMTEQTSPQAIVLFGPTAANGKSEVLELFRCLFPDQSIASIPPGEFGDDRKLIELRGKALNLCSELGTGKAISSDKFKAVIAGDEVTARGMYSNASRFRPRAMHIFATNTLPGFAGGMDEGVVRRLQVLEFDRTIPQRERIPNIGRKVCEQDTEALVGWLVEGASRVIKQGGLSNLNSGNKAVRDWVLQSDFVKAWIADRCSFSSGEQTPSQILYLDFCDAWERAGRSPHHRPAIESFSKRLIAAGHGRIVADRSNGQRVISGIQLKSRSSQSSIIRSRV